MNTGGTVIMTTHTLKSDKKSLPVSPVAFYVCAFACCTKGLYVSIRDKGVFVCVCVGCNV
jgi:hypothetical protein